MPLNTTFAATNHGADRQNCSERVILVLKPTIIFVLKVVGMIGCGRFLRI
jgi:hypothetical protein